MDVSGIDFDEEFDSSAKAKSDIKVNGHVGAKPSASQQERWEWQEPHTYIFSIFVDNLP